VAHRAEQDANRVLADVRRTWSDNYAEPAWWHEDWVSEQINRAAQSFDDAL
jgi:hypothetical protein